MGTAGGGSPRPVYLSEVDAVCAAATRQLAAVPPAIGPSDLVATLKSQLAVQQQALAAFRQIAVPAADQKAIRARLLNPLALAVSGQRSLLPAVAADIKSGDDVGLASIHQRYDEVSHPPAIASFVIDYGLKTCGTFEYFRPH